jgi:DNA-binding MltR family transcriptional regulator
MPDSNTPTFNDIVKELNETPTDRGVAVLAAALLEELLVDLMRHAFIQHNDLGSIIRTGNARGMQVLAYTTGIIPHDLYIDLQTVSGIRNKFAHKISTQTFDQTAIAELIRSLKPLASSIPVKGIAFLTSQGAQAQELQDLPLKIQFAFATAIMSVMLEEIKASLTPFLASNRPYPSWQAIT